MHTNIRLLAALLGFVITAAIGAPLSAWQTAPPRQTNQTAAPRGTTRQAPPNAGTAPRAYPGRQTSGTAAPGEQPAARVAQQPPSAGRLPQQAPAQAMPQQAPHAVIRGVGPQAPFALTPVQQQLLDAILMQWERQSDRVDTFKCSFGRWEVNETFGPKEFNYVLSEGKGYIKFKSPDHGIYRITELTEWDDQRKTYAPRTTGLDHWVCTGKSIFEFNAEKKQLIERELAPGLRGKAITDGPLPFIFGANAAQLKQRYWLRDVTQPANVNRQIWLEAWPKRQQDAANFQHAVVVLNKQTFLPEALRIILPDGKNKQDYAFSSTQLNDPLSILKGDFLPPIKPLGWTSVFEPAQGSEQAVVAPPDEPASAQRMAPNVRQ